MNEMLKNIARNYLLEGLATLTEDERMFFKRMYSPDFLDADIPVIVSNMPEDKLDWAMQQIKNTLDTRK